MMDDDMGEEGFLKRWMPRNPKDVVCLGLAVVATGYIVINALFLQSGPHPAPFFSTDTTKTAAVPASDVPMPPAKRQASTRIPAATLPAAAPLGPTPPAPIPVRTAARPDPIAELLEPSNKTIAVQRALTEFGYGQIKPTGNVGPDTKAAIEKFERERKLPVTGRLSERLTQELTALKGAPL
jgi:hypothetical protein